MALGQGQPEASVHQAQSPPPCHRCHRPGRRHGHLPRSGISLPKVTQLMLLLVLVARPGCTVPAAATRDSLATHTQEARQCTP